MKKSIWIINGPNLNLLGKREIDIYGNKPFEEILQDMKDAFPAFDLSFYQSNVEGELINKIQEAGFGSDGIIFNPGGYSHTSVAIGDAIGAVTAPVIEVHLSNIHAREPFRNISYTARNSIGIISGFGPDSYRLALRHFEQKFSVQG